jgi:hypothetical protein
MRSRHARGWQFALDHRGRFDGQRVYPRESVGGLRTGVTPDGDVFDGSMAEVVHGSTKFVLRRHLEDIATYLLDLDGK